MRQIIVIAPDIRSSHNVGALLRTAEGLAARVILCGYTPHPTYPSDPRLPHLAAKQTAQIAKTALGAESSDIWQYQADVNEAITKLKADGYIVVALEQTPKSTSLVRFKPSDKVAIVLGPEVTGLNQDLINKCDQVVEIPMYGQKESFNVTEAASMAMFYLRVTK